MRELLNLTLTFNEKLKTINVYIWLRSSDG